jgi:hypothetical protein
LLDFFVNADVLVGAKLRRIWYIGWIEFVTLKEIGFIAIALVLLFALSRRCVKPSCWKRIPATLSGTANEDSVLTQSNLW